MDRERKRHFGLNFKNSYAIKNAMHIYRTSAKFPAFLQTVEKITHYCLSSQHTRSIGWHKYFYFGNSRFHISPWNSNILNFIAALSGNIPHYISKTAFITHSINYKLPKTKWSDQCSGYKINPGLISWVKFTWHWGYTEQHAACLMLTHIFFTVRRNRVRAVYLISVPLHYNI